VRRCLNASQRPISDSPPPLSNTQSHVDSGVLGCCAPAAKAKKNTFTSPKTPWEVLLPTARPWARSVHFPQLNICRSPLQRRVQSGGRLSGQERRDTSTTPEFSPDVKQVTWRRGVSSNARAEHVWRPSPLPTPAYESPPSSGNFASRADNAAWKHSVGTMKLILRAPPIAKLVGEHRSPLVHAASTATQLAAHTAARDTRITVFSCVGVCRPHQMDCPLPTTFHTKTALSTCQCASQSRARRRHLGTLRRRRSCPLGPAEPPPAPREVSPAALHYTAASPRPHTRRTLAWRAATRALNFRGRGRVDKRRRGAWRCSAASSAAEPAAEGVVDGTARQRGADGAVAREPRGRPVSRDAAAHPGALAARARGCARTGAGGPSLGSRLYPGLRRGRDRVRLNTY
jgi:hypothetical protein